jgi:hypothetical protein
VVDDQRQFFEMRVETGSKSAAMGGNMWKMIAKKKIAGVNKAGYICQPYSCSSVQ